MNTLEFDNSVQREYDKIVGEDPQPLKGVLCYRKGCAIDENSNKVYFIADQIRNENDAVRVYIHCQVGHLGLKTLLKTHYNRVMLAIFDSVGIRDISEAVPKAEQYNFDFTMLSNTSKIHLTSEYLSNAAETMLCKDDLNTNEPSVWKEQISNVKMVIAKVHNRKLLSLDDIKRLVIASSQNLFQISKMDFTNSTHN